MESRLFHVFGGISRLAALSVILVSNPVHSVLSLIVAFVSACGLMMLLQVEFMSLVFVVVYVGAIAVLFLFVVMMLNLNSIPAQRTFSAGRLDRWAALRVVRSMMERRRVGLGSSFESASHVDPSMTHHVQWVERLDPMTTLETMGQLLYTHKFIYLLMAGFVLLVARVGAIVLTLKVRTFARSKRQQVHQQRSRDAERALMMTRVGS